MPQIYLIRHGIAVDRTAQKQDFERSLTPQGKQKTLQVAQRLQALGVKFDLILTSPLRRACQTAEILAAQGLSSWLEESLDLSPQGSLSNWLLWLETWRSSADHQALALVGHQPDLGQWAEVLLWGEAKGTLVLKKAGIIGITLPEVGPAVGHSQLFWLTQPKLLI